MMQAVAPLDGCVPSNEEPQTWFHPLSMQPQHPPKLAGIVMPPSKGGHGAKLAAVFFTPRCQRSGRPASSAQKIVVEVPSVIVSMLTGATPGRKKFQFSTPSRKPQFPATCGSFGPTRFL